VFLARFYGSRCAAAFTRLLFAQGKSTLLVVVYLRSLAPHDEGFSRVLVERAVSAHLSMDITGRCVHAARASRFSGFSASSSARRLPSFVDSRLLLWRGQTPRTSTLVHVVTTPQARYFFLRVTSECVGVPILVSLSCTPFPSHDLSPAVCFRMPPPALAPGVLHQCLPVARALSHRNADLRRV